MMPLSKDGKFYGNAQRARALNSAAMPRPKPMQKKDPESAGGHDADHGGVAKVETVVHHQDGHQERKEHGSVQEATDHLHALENDPMDVAGAEGEAGEGAEEVCPDCQGQDPNCPTCGGTGKVPVEQGGESGGGSY